MIARVMLGPQVSRAETSDRVSNACAVSPLRKGRSEICCLDKERLIMNEDAKKTALRMIPYGLYVLTAEGKNGAVAAATVNWVTQTAFTPPLVVMGVKTDSGAHAIIKETGEFALNILGKGQQAMAFNFFK